MVKNIWLLEYIEEPFFVNDIDWNLSIYHELNIDKRNAKKWQNY